ncbi:MAG: SpoIID/LytB domain-containing protein [Myxococcales bacterium]|nr:SpoIID/LytB domain-containing protein [Myxococcales bacterium]
MHKRSRQINRLLWLAGACFALLLSAGTPQFQPSPPLETLPQSSLSPIATSVQVIDILTRQPIAGARLFIEGVARIGLTDQTGRFLLTPPNRTSYSIRVEAPGYMGTTQAYLSPKHHHQVLVAMPPMARLVEADRLIRAPETLQHRHQEQPPPMEIPREGDPIPFAPTYPVPATIEIENNTTTTYQVGGTSLPPNGKMKLALEEYLRGVLPKEIGSSFPLEAQKAQAIAARSYTVNYTQGGKRSICITTKCQVWGTTQYTSTTRAVDETRSQVAVYGTSLVGGYFAASCGGSTRSNKDAGWSSTALPYLQSVDCIENKVDSCSVICKGQPSNSTCWGVYGHRVGLCQRGAQAMGKCGKTYIQIVKHYYTGSDIANLAAAPVDDAKLTQETANPITVATGDTAKKTWTLENTGTTTWSRGGGYALVRTGGDDLGLSRIELGSADQIKPGQTKAFQGSFTAPATAGTYKSTWKIEVSGTRFGPALTVELKVEPKIDCVDKDGDGYGVGKDCKGPDCNDNDPKIHPGAREICGNGVDEDCKDGDLACPPACEDKDQDGYFAQKAGCPEPFDCDDNNKDIYPGAPDICGNGIDEDCAGGDRPCSATCEDKDGDGYGVGSGCKGPDCNDNDPNVHPGATEICGNNIDEDCDGKDLPCSASKKALGESCQNHGDCQSDLCVQVGSESRCSQNCTNNTACPSGYQCVQNSACWPQPSATPCNQRCNDADCKQDPACKPQITPTGAGCTCQSSQIPPTMPLFWLLTLLFFLRRRHA